MRSAIQPARRRLALLAFFVFGLAACGGSPAAVPATPSPIQEPPPGATAPPARPTLPPTWTLTPTWTPRPPSATPSVTPPPTLAPTLDAEERCAAFALLGAPVDGLRRTRQAAAGVTFTWAADRAEVTVRLHLSAAASGRTWEVTAAGPVVLALPFRRLAGPDVYHWQIGPLDEDGAPLVDCAVSGRFTLLLRDRTARTERSGPALFVPEPRPAADTRPAAPRR